MNKLTITTPPDIYAEIITRVHVRARLTNTQSAYHAAAWAMMLEWTKDQSIKNITQQRHDEIKLKITLPVAIMLMYTILGYDENDDPYLQTELMHMQETVHQFIQQQQIINNGQQQHHRTLPLLR